MNARERLERIERELNAIRGGLGVIPEPVYRELFLLIMNAEHRVGEALHEYRHFLEKVEVPGE